MEKIGNLVANTMPNITTTSTEPCVEPSNPRHLERKWRIYVWKELTCRYGSRFTSQHPRLEDSLVVWSEVLYGLGADELKTGLDNLPPSFPPTAMEFQMLCRPKNEAAHRPYRQAALPRTTWLDRRKTAKEQLKVIRMELKKKEMQ